MGIAKHLGCAMLVLLVPLLRGVHGGGMAISTDGMRFVDAEGRTVILRGFNVAGDAKLPDYRPLKNLATLNGEPSAPWQRQHALSLEPPVQGVCLHAVAFQEEFFENILQTLFAEDHVMLLKLF